MTADEEPSLRALIDDAWVSLTAMGLADGASLDNLTVTSDLAAAVKDTQFVQESVPESLPLKQSLYKQLSDLVAAKCCYLFEHIRSAYDRYSTGM